jgi:hypothetical protein
MAAVGHFHDDSEADHSEPVVFDAHDHPTDGSNPHDHGAGSCSLCAGCCLTIAVAPPVPDVAWFVPCRHKARCPWRVRVSRPVANGRGIPASRGASPARATSRPLSGDSDPRAAVLPAFGARSHQRSRPWRQLTSTEGGSHRAGFRMPAGPLRPRMAVNAAKSQEHRLG